MSNLSVLSLLRKVHGDEQGTVSLETILIIGAIALPVVLWLTLKGWPMVKAYFTEGIEDLDEGRREVFQ